MSPLRQHTLSSGRANTSLLSLISPRSAHGDNHQFRRKNMAKSHLFGFLFAVLICVFCASDVFAQALIFGPKTYTRVNGAKNIFTDSFSLSSLQGTFTLIVENGNANGSSRVMNGSITLNGIEVVTQKDFHLGRIEKTITPLANNSLTVQLKGGPPNSFITVSIVRQIEDREGPVITI